MADEKDLHKQRMAVRLLKAQVAAQKALTPEFQAQYESLLGGVGTRDPQMIRLHEPDNLNLRGYAVLPTLSDIDMAYLRKRYEPHGLAVEPNTVNAVGASNMRPELIAHEFRHLQVPGMSERQNRLADAAVAETEPQWEDAARMYANGRGALPSEALASLFRNLRGGYAYDEYDRQFALGARPKNPRKWWHRVDGDQFRLRKEKMAATQWDKQREDYESYEDWNAALKQRNAAIRKEIEKQKRAKK